MGQRDGREHADQNGKQPLSVPRKVKKFHGFKKQWVEKPAQAWAPCPVTKPAGLGKVNCVGLGHVRACSTLGPRAGKLRRLLAEGAEARQDTPMADRWMLFAAVRLAAQGPPMWLCRQPGRWAACPRLHAGGQRRCPFPAHGCSHRGDGGGQSLLRGSPSAQAVAIVPPPQKA